MYFHVQKYLKVSSIHGLFYTSKRFHLVERIFWIVVLFFSVACTAILIVELAIKMHFIPVVVYVADVPVPVTQIPFPAVTVCPQLMPYFRYHRAKPYRVFSYEKHTGERFYFEHEEFWDEIEDERKFGNLTYSKVFVNGELNMYKNFSYLKILQQIEEGALRPQELGLKILKRLQVIDLITKRGVFSKQNFSIPADDFLDYINQFAKQFKETGSSMSSTLTGNYGSEIITEYGLCYSLNLAYSHDLLNLNSTSDDFNYQLYAPHGWRVNRNALPVLPVNIPSSHAELCAEIHIIYKTILEIVLNKFDGILFLLHNPYELPSENSKKLVLHYERRATIWIDVKMNDIDDSMHDYSPDERNCYLEHEKVLKFFKVYTRNNCEMECQSDFVLSRCGCVEFFMIRNSTSRICMASERNCTELARNDFYEIKKDCKCLQPCENLEYSFELDEKGFLKNEETPENDFNRPLKDRADMLLQDRNLMRFGDLKHNFADASVKYREESFEVFVRKKQFNILDFLSFVGGLFGLFAGFSTLSFVELVYWFTIRFAVEKFKKLKSKIYAAGMDPQETVDGVLASYLVNSSVHGLNHIMSYAKLDSFLWIIFIITSLTVCSDMIRGVREKVPNSRVTVYDDNFKPLENIPFPAVTLVPEYYWSDDFSQADHFIGLLEEKNYIIFENETEQMIFVRNLTNEGFCMQKYGLHHFDVNITFIPYLFSILKEHSMIDWFRKQFSSLNRVYQPEYAEIQTIRGMGFAFNMIDSYEMFNVNQLSDPYNYIRNVTTANSDLKKIPPSVYPLKFSSLENPVLNIKLKRLKTKEFVCHLPSFLVHNSDYLPTFSGREDFIHFQYGMDIHVEVTPKIIKTDEGLRKLAPDQRECYFEGEKSLKYFKKYSERNCEIECYTNFTVSACGCTDINQPFESESQICQVISKLEHSEQYCPSHIMHKLIYLEYFSPAMNCSCLPTCNSVTYNVKYNAEFNTKGSRVGRTGNETSLNVWMNMDEIILMRRYQQFTTSDVISYVGGLLGLFAGISMLSIVEFVYFFTLRIGSDLYRMMMKRNKRKIVNWVNK